MERERRIGREGEIGSDIRRRDSGEIESAINSKPSKIYRSAIFIMVSRKSYDSEGRTSKYRRTTTEVRSCTCTDEDDESTDRQFGTNQTNSLHDEQPQPKRLKKVSEETEDDIKGHGYPVEEDEEEDITDEDVFEKVDAILGDVPTYKDGSVNFSKPMTAFCMAKVVDLLLPGRFKRDSADGFWSDVPHVRLALHGAREHARVLPGAVRKSGGLSRARACVLEQACLGA
jgi:hypothetical protein